MSGPDTPETPPPDVPEEFAATYAEAYRRALESGQYDELDTGIHPVVFDPDQVEAMIPEVDPQPVETVGTHRPVALVEEPRRWLVPVFVALLAILLIAGAYGVGKAVSGSEDEPTASVTSADPTPGQRPSQRPSRQPRPSPTPSDVPTSTAQVWDGEVEEVRADRARATCRAPASTDSSGERVRYGAPNTLDGDPATAWRCNGDAIGESVRFRFDDPVDVAEVGLVPGYAKTDPASGADRFTENNRITRVRWTLADGVVVEQNLDPDDRGLQTVRVPRTATDEILLEILAVDQGPRNTTAISDVAFAAAD